MKRALSLFFTFLFVLAGFYYCLREEPVGELALHQIVRVIDGDTYILDNGEKVRIIGVNTPELVPEEPLAAEAKEFAREYLQGHYVYLEKDQQDQDPYGRLLRYIWLKNPETTHQKDRWKYNFSTILLEKGYARVYTFKPNVKYYNEFLQVEKYARRKKCGIWQQEEPITRGNNLR